MILKRAKKNLHFHEERIGADSKIAGRKISLVSETSRLQGELYARNLVKVVPTGYL